MTLNYYGGRSQNDLSQYPVFPWIFSNYCLLEGPNNLDPLAFTSFY